MSNAFTKTTFAALLFLAAAAPSIPAVAQEAIMLESHGFVRMIQPEQPREIEVPQQRKPQADERQHASAE